MPHKEKFIIDRTSPWLFFPDLFPHGMLRNLATRMIPAAVLAKEIPFVQGYEAVLPTETEAQGGVLFLLFEGKIVLCSLPQEDYGVDLRSTDGQGTQTFFPTKTEYVPRPEQMIMQQSAAASPQGKSLQHFWFNSEALTADMFSVVTGGIDSASETPSLALVRETFEELGLAIAEQSIVELPLPPFEIWQLTTKNTTFRGSIIDLFLGKYPVTIDSLQKAQEISRNELPFRFGRYIFAAQHFCSYTLSAEQLAQLRARMAQEKRTVIVASVAEALQKNLRPSTRTALELWGGGE